MVVRPWISRGNMTRIFFTGFVLIPSIFLAWKHDRMETEGSMGIAGGIGPPKSQSWKAAFQDFNHENFHFINSSYEFKTPWGSNPNLHKRILEPYSLYFGYTWILTDGIPIVTPAETYPFPWRKSWFMAPPQGAVVALHEVGRVLVPEYFNLSWGLPGGSSPLQLQHGYYLSGWISSKGSKNGASIHYDEVDGCSMSLWCHDLKWFQIRYGHGPWVSIQARPGRRSPSLDLFLSNVGIISGKWIFTCQWRVIV